MEPPNRLTAGVLAAAAIVLVGLLIVRGSDDDNGEGEFPHVEALPSSACDEVEYGGEGEPNALIASDLPMQGDSAGRSEQMVAAIRQVLENQGWQAGQTRIAFQACDDSIPDTGEWDADKCKDNATNYVSDEDVIGVIGTYNSGCAAEIIPILNGAPGGGVAMVSPGNTLICLTEPAAGCEPGQPDSLYPSGARNYARVVPNDAFQGAGLASFARDQGVRKPYVLFAADDPTSEGQAATFRGAAKALGLEVAGYESWDPEATDYIALMQKVRGTGADGVVLAGLLEQNGPQLIRDKVKVLGPNGGKVKLLAPDGFAQQATIDDAGPDSAGMFVSVPGRTPESLTGPGKAFVDQLTAELGRRPGRALRALRRPGGRGAAGGDRPERRPRRRDRRPPRSRVENGIVGSFAITPTGDPTLGPVSVSVAGDSFELAAEILPPPELVAAARGG